MRKTLSTIALAVVAVLGAPTAAQAYSWPNDVPQLPACASTLSGPTSPTSWTGLETRCSVTASGANRLYINMLELFVDELNAATHAVQATATHQAATIAAQSARIDRQARRIDRLRTRLNHG